MTDKTKYSYFNQSYSIEYKYAPHSGPIPPHTHNAVEFYLNMTDMPYMLFGTTIMPIPKNTLIIFPEYCVHSLRSYRGEAYKRFVLTVNSSLLLSILGENYAHYNYLKDYSSPVMISLDDETLNKLFESMLRLENAQSELPFRQAAMLFETLSLIDSLVAPNAQHIPHKDNLSVLNQTVNKIIEYINEHLYEGIQVKQIAAQFYLSPDYTSKIFKRYTGTTISNFITVQRIANAKRMLSEGMSVSEVQQRTGYSSYSYFFRTFKKTAGMTPSEFAAQK